MAMEFHDVPAETVDQIKSALYRGNKIEAIKLYREATRLGLAESKHFIEAVELKLREEEPQLFLTGPKGTGCGVGVLALLAIVGSAAFAAWAT
jgi:hypothetical protein